MTDSTTDSLARAWVGRLPWRRPLNRLRAAWLYARTRLRRSAVRFNVAPGRLPDCPNCRDSCCRAPHLVSLRLADVARLHDAGLGWAMTAGDAAERAPVYDEHPELRQVERRPAFRDFPVLRHTQKGACVFLDATARCSIYALRPLACRAFPFRLDDDLQTVRYSNGCPSSRTDGSRPEQEALIDAVVANFNNKVRDLLMLRFGADALTQPGLQAYLPGPERGRRFADAVARAQSDISGES